MAINFGGAKVDYVSLPKPGEEGTKVFNVVRFEERRQEGHKQNFKNKDGEDSGFYYLAHLDDGSVFTINVYKLFYALRDAYDVAGIPNGADGVILEIGHPGRGEWSVKIIGQLDTEEVEVNNSEDVVVEEVVEKVKTKVKVKVKSPTPVTNTVSKTKETEKNQELKNDINMDEMFADL